MQTAYARRKERERQQRIAQAVNNVQFRLSAFTVQCKHCGAFHFEEERVMDQRKKQSFNDCCNHGRFRLPALPDYPDVLRQFFANDHAHGANFFANIRKINSAFACASLSVLRYKFPTRGPPCFRISGQVYHCFNKAVQPDPGQRPSNGQLFFVDTEEALSERERLYPEASAAVMKAYEDFLRDKNPIAQAYGMMKEEMEHQHALAQQNGEEPKKLKLLFSLKKGYDARRYNIPTSNEVAAVFVSNAEEEIPPAHIVIHERGKDVTHLKVFDPMVEPMLYPLFYPLGNLGWSVDLKDDKGKKITMRDYAGYKLAIRPDDNGNIVHLGRKLFQQWVVDQYARIEWDRLLYIQLNQAKIHAASYKGLDDYLQARAELSNAQIGRRIILPSSYVGSPRNMHQLYNDAMALVRKFGKPDLFVTMTCNPEDPDILGCLRPGQKPIDRPDIVARVFDLKKQALLDNIVKGEKFGKVIAYCYVIEFQKRGLPHMHLLVTLAKENKLYTSAEVDKCISAELPDLEEDPVLFECISKMHMHSCDQRCMVDGVCSKNFPKAFIEATEMNENGYPFYKRPNNGRHVFVKAKRLDNRHVVPYNPDFIRKYRCHINVEKVSDVQAVKYLYKYIYKGYDSATVDIVQGTHVVKYDEIVQHLDCRYIGPVEACWRIFEKSLQAKSHSIDRLPVHLPGEQTVYYAENADNNTVAEILEKDTKLTAFFAFNVKHGKNLLYSEIPEHGTWKKGAWDLRKAKIGQVLGRMNTINPSDMELFHLRLLLLHVRGPKSFEELRTHNDVLHQTFAQACLARGLIEDDSELERCLTEAASYQFPSQLRNLFATILVHCGPKYPEKLWDHFKDDLSYDMKRIYPGDMAYDMAYFRIVRKLVDQGVDMAKDFPSMPQINLADFNAVVQQIDRRREAHLADQMFRSMNAAQKAVFNRVQEFLQDDGIWARCLFIDGPGGSGKTYVYSAINHLAKSLGKNVVNTAFSGIAATLLPNGRTNHKVFGLPKNLDNEATSSIEGQTKEGKALRETDVFVWDEAPMSPKYALEMADRLLRDLTGRNRPFGGKIMLLGGDFRQVLPIKKRANRSELISLSIRRSRLWNLFEQFQLTQNMRARGNAQQFAKDLLAIGDGASNDENDLVALPPNRVVQGNLPEVVFADIIARQQYGEMAKCAILAIQNVDVHEHNDKVLDMIQEPERIYYSVDKVPEEDKNPVQVELLHAFNTAGLPPHRLRLKKNSIIMLIRNLNVDKGLCNGTRLQVLDLQNHVLRCVILTGDKTGKEVFIPRITIVYNEGDLPCAMTRHQFPVKLSFAMTVNKSQGQTFEKIGIDFRKPSFSHGQTYVALSRTKAWDCVNVQVPNNTDASVLNVVFDEVLRDED